MSWENVSQWYDKLVGEKGQYYHREVVIPGVLRLLDAPTAVLDLACGQGILARHLPKSCAYVGVDASASLIKAAKGYRLGAEKTFQTHDLMNPLSLEKKNFSHACIVLALQNFPDPTEVLRSAYKHLAPKGQLILVMNHPCFRIPRQTSWGIDEKKKCQYRRLDCYMSPLEIPIQTRPGSKPNEKTMSFHFPISYYINLLGSIGFGITHMEEWVSNKVSTGKKAKMENRARAEFPLFMSLTAMKHE